MSGITILIIAAAAMACALGGVSLLAHVYTLNSIKSKTVGDEKRNKAGLQAYSVHAGQVAGAGEKRP